ncbi:MAG: GPR endopeptidase [Bacilli bacterium]|nr:GPR endopeptidase [Bacilli bacterium]
MKHEIDLGKYQLRTDLAIELVNDDSLKTEVIDGVKVTSIYIDKDKSMIINKKVGNYITIEFDDITDYDNRECVKRVFVSELGKLIDILGINDKDTCLVVGLGNVNSTPDSLGPMSVSNLIITNHLYELGELGSNYRRVSSLVPGVMAETGIETSDIIKSVVFSVKPNFVIVIDALASSSIERVNKTIQITDTGIHPGSGIGNSRKEISSDVLGVPVIAIGVPTTVDAVSIVSDTIDYMSRHFSYIKQNIDNPMNRLIVKGNVNFLDKDVVVKKEDRERLFGLVGNLSHDETRQLIDEVLTPIGYNFMVTPKEIDFVIVKLCDVIGNGINDCLHDLS